ncbi:MAG: hypothetical protein ACJAXB_002203 [Candidatus Endobugula sp.]|jgi:hypothetical protein
MKTPSKKERVLFALFKGFYNRFEAERKLSDHCLHSTVSTLQNSHGIEVKRKFEMVPGYMGIMTKVCRYWIEQSQYEKALTLARLWRQSWN